MRKFFYIILVLTFITKNIYCLNSLDLSDKAQTLDDNSLYKEVFGYTKNLFQQNKIDLSNYENIELIEKSSIESLNLSHCNLITSDGIKKLLPLLVYLKEIKLDYCNYIKFKGLCYIIANCPILKTISIIGTKKIPDWYIYGLKASDYNIINIKN